MNTIPICAASSMATSTATSQPQSKEKYRTLKRKFKFLVYENECYQEELRNLQRRLLKLSRDKNFLLDRLMQYEKVSDSSDDSDPPTPAPKTSTDAAAKPKKQKKPATAKRSRAKQPVQPQSSIVETTGPPSTPVSTVSSAAAAVSAATIRGRPRKSNTNEAGRESSDAEMGTSSSGPTQDSGMVMGTGNEVERIPSHLVLHYPSPGIYEQHVPAPPPPLMPPSQDEQNL